VAPDRVAALNIAPGLLKPVKETPSRHSRLEVFIEQTLAIVWIYRAVFLVGQQRWWHYHHMGCSWRDWTIAMHLQVIHQHINLQHLIPEVSGGNDAGWVDHDP